MKTKHVLSTLFFLFLILLSHTFNQDLQAQSIRRQGISSYGSVSIGDKLKISQTAGQCYNTTNHFDNSAALCQGFQQSSNFYVQHFGTTVSKMQTIKVFPNPSSYSIMLNSDKAEELSQIHIMDINGTVYYSKEATILKDYTIPCELWPQGIYLIKIIDAQQNIQTLKLIIAK